MNSILSRGARDKDQVEVSTGATTGRCPYFGTWQPLPQGPALHKQKEADLGGNMMRRLHITDDCSPPITIREVRGKKLEASAARPPDIESLTLVRRRGGSEDCGIVQRDWSRKFLAGVLDLV